MRASRENAKPSLMRRAVACLVSAAMVVAFTPVVAWGDSYPDNLTFDIAEGDVTIGKGIDNETIKVTYGVNSEKDNIYPAQTITIKGTTTTNRIVVNTGSGVTANIKLSSVNIQFAEDPNVGNGKCAFNIISGSKVNLTLVGENILTSNGEYAGLQVPQESELIINGPGSLEATARNDGAGIGGGHNGAGGSVTITGGTVTATGVSGAGIGGGDGSKGGSVLITGGTVEAEGATGIGGGYSGGDGGSVTITGGAVTATSSGNGAGIGGGYGNINGGSSGSGGDGGSVTITGGTVTAIGESGSAGIGGGYGGWGGDGGDGGSVTITGGTVIATAHSAGTPCGAGIGGGNGGGSSGGNGSKGADGTFKTNDGTNNGNAVVFASSISDKSGKTGGSWSGVIFEGDSGSVYGNPTLCSDLTFPTGAGSVASTMAKNLTVPSGSTLTIAEGKTLTVPSGSTLSNESSIYVDGTLSGTVSGNGAVYYPLTLNTVDGTINSGDIKYYNCKADTTLPTDVTKANFTFEGWHDNAGCTGNAVASITANTTTGEKEYWANWEADSYTVTLDTNGGAINSGNVSSYTYGVGATLPTDVTKSGYKFDGWYDSTDAAVTAISATDTGEKTFYAKWTAVEYDIIYKLDGGTNDDANPAKYTIESDTITLKPGKRSGYTFAGWYEGDSKVEQIAKGTVGNKTLTAKWNYVPPSDPSYNVPATVKGGIAVKVTVSGSTAVVGEISASALESAAGSGAESITIDLSGLPKGVTQAQLSKSTVDKLLAVVNDAGNAVESVTVKFGSAVLVIDAKALAAVAEQAKGTSVTLGVKETKADSLNSAQKQALSPFEVVQLYFEAVVKSGGVEIHDFGGGSVRVSVAFEPRAGHNPARYVVLYVGENGAIERYATAWAAGMLSFMAPHFSTYAVVYVKDATQAAIDALEALPDAGKLKASQAKAAVKKAEAALKQVVALDDGQKILVDEALVTNAKSVVKRGNELVATADKKAVGKVKNKAFSVKAGKSKSIAFKTKVSAAGTKVAYKKSKGSKYISVTKSGKVTAKKGMKKGKTYTAKVKVTCGKSWKYVKATVKVRG